MVWRWAGLQFPHCIGYDKAAPPGTAGSIFAGRRTEPADQSAGEWLPIRPPTVQLYEKVTRNARPHGVPSAFIFVQKSPDHEIGAGGRDIIALPSVLLQQGSNLCAVVSWGGVLSLTIHVQDQPRNTLVIQNGRAIILLFFAALCLMVGRLPSKQEISVRARCAAHAIRLGARLYLPCLTRG